MRRILIIAAREVEAWRQVLVLATAVGSFPLLAAFLPDVTRADRTAIAKALLVVLTAVLAPLLGASLLSPELAGRRLSFYLTRPLGTATLVIGKALGAAVLLAAAQLATLAPAVLVAGPGIASGDASFSLLVAAASGALFAAGLAAGFLLRLRSRMLLLDAAALLICGALLALIVHRWGFAWRLARLQPATSPPVAATLQLCWAMAAGAATLALVWLAAAAGGVATGGTEARRVHRTVSLIGWSGSWLLMVALAILPDLLHGEWPARGSAPIRSAGGGWAVLDGSPGPPRFVHLASNQLRLPPWERSRSYTIAGVQIARSAPVAAWTRVRADWLGRYPGRYSAGTTDAPVELVSLDLATPRARLRAITLGDRGITTRLALSPDGGTAAMVEDGGRVWAVDLATGTVIFDGRGPHAAPGTRVDRFVFADQRTLRFYTTSRAITEGGAPVPEIRALDLGNGKSATTARLAERERWGRTSFDGSRILTVGSDVVSVRDGATGRREQTYRLDGADPGSFAILADGAVVMAGWRAGRIHVELGTGGTWRPPIDLGPAPAPRYPHLSSTDPHTRIVYVRLGSDRELRVDLETGAVARP